MERFLGRPHKAPFVASGGSCFLPDELLLDSRLHRCSAALRQPWFPPLSWLAYSPDAAGGPQPTNAIQEAGSFRPYNNGVITVQHEGNTYKAKCYISRSFKNVDSVTDPNNVHTFPTCDVVIGFVGQNIQSFDGQQKHDTGGL
jgi:hypothetical protein